MKLFETIQAINTSFSLEPNEIDSYIVDAIMAKEGDEDLFMSPSMIVVKNNINNMNNMTTDDLKFISRVDRQSLKIFDIYSLNLISKLTIEFLSKTLSYILDIISDCDKDVIPKLNNYFYDIHMKIMNDINDINRQTIFYDYYDSLDNNIFNLINFRDINLKYTSLSQIDMYFQNIKNYINNIIILSFDDNYDAALYILGYINNSFLYIDFHDKLGSIFKNHYENIIEYNNELDK